MFGEPAHASVAIIEDDDAARAALGRVLRAGGFETALFENAEAFIASRAGQPWLCLIVDVQLTGMSGIHLQRTLRHQGFDAPIIIITANRADVIRERAEQGGCAAFLWKPFSADAILSLLASIARRTDA